jgi:hypothetical protein
MSTVKNRPVEKKRGGSVGAHKGGVKVAGMSVGLTASKAIFSLPVSDIVCYENPRLEPEILWDKGYILIGDSSVEKPVMGGHGQILKRVSLKHLALSENIQFVQFFVNLMEETEAVNRDVNRKRPQTIIELAKDIAELGQLEPIKVHQSEDGWIGDDGARRFCAILYLHARDRVKIFKKDKDAPETPFPAVVQATTLTCLETDRFVVAAKINLSRKGYTELQEGRVYHEMLQRVNPETLHGQRLYSPKHPDGRTYTMKEAALKLNVHPSTFRNREALWHPYRVLRKQGDIVVDRRGLSEDERAAIRDGRMLPTYASRLSLGESTNNVSRNGGNRIGKKHKALTLKQMEWLFDTTPADQRDRRVTIAECMNKTYEVALSESRARLDAGMEQIERGMGRKHRGDEAA